MTRRRKDTAAGGRAEAGKPVAAKDVMSAPVMTVPEDMTVPDLEELLTEKMITGAPVVNAEGEMIGLVSRTDVLRSESRRHRIARQSASPDGSLQGWQGKVNEEDIAQLTVDETDDLTARDIMTPTVYTVSEETPVSEIAGEMVRGRIHRLVVTRADRPVGIVTTLDILRALCLQGGKRERL